MAETIQEEVIPQLMEAESTSTSSTTSSSSGKSELVKFVVNYKKQNHDIEFGLDQTLSELRVHLANLTGVAAALQKLMYKGLVKDDAKTLRELGLKDGVKLMLVGSTINEVMAASVAPTEAQVAEMKEAEESKEVLSEKTQHKKIVDKGVPEGAEPGKKGKHEPLPKVPLQGIYNNVGIKVRLTFKVYSQELWISSVTTTQKIPFATIRTIMSEPIKGKEEYHIMSLQLGSSDKNKYFLYFVPAQYTRAIKNTIMSDYTGGFST